MANKQDLLSALTPEELTIELGLDEIRERSWQILPCSAKTGDGLQDSMEWIVEQINTQSGGKSTLVAATPTITANNGTETIASDNAVKEATAKMSALTTSNPDGF